VTPCPACGAQTPGKFCPNCGTPVSQQSVPAQYQPPYAPLGPRPSGSGWVKWVLIAGGGLLGMVALLVVLLIALTDDPAPSQPVAGNGAPASQPAPAQKAPATQPAASTEARKYFVARWRCWAFAGGQCPVGWEQMLVKEDGTYTLAGVPGTWKMEGTKAVFSGPLAFAGPAEPYEKDQFKFDYVEKQSGLGTYILFVKW
jgi:hypothetical protein